MEIDFFKEEDKDRKKQMMLAAALGGASPLLQQAQNNPAMGMGFFGAASPLVEKLGESKLGKIGMGGLLGGLFK